MHDWEGLGAQAAAVTLTLREAAQRLRDGGWCQGKFTEDDGRQDATQAIASVVGIRLSEACRKDHRIPAGPCVLLGAALERVNEQVGRPRALSVWNDDPERTQEQVINALESAAA
jgi:hypothetical protein